MRTQAATKLLAAALLVLAVRFPYAVAAEITVLQIPGQEVSTVVLVGEINAGDADKFYEAVSTIERAQVLLESPGGLVSEALRIGAEIRARDFATLVAPYAGCFSSCGLIWVSGGRRYMAPTSRIGFHAAFREERAEYIESGVANAEIGSFLTHLGLRIEAIRFFTIAGPNELLLLTPARARALGIQIFELRGMEVVTPQDAPTVDVYADRFVSYGILRSQCAGYFQMDDESVERAQMDAIEMGEAIVGREQWIKIWIRMYELAEEEIVRKLQLPVCLDTEANLRSQGLPTGIDGPSYTCSNQLTLTEKAICSDQDLWAKDRAMNAIYIWIRKNLEPIMRRQIPAGLARG